MLQTVSVKRPCEAWVCELPRCARRLTHGSRHASCRASTLAQRTNSTNTLKNKVSHVVTRPFWLFLFQCPSSSKTSVAEVRRKLVKPCMAACLKLVLPGRRTSSGLKPRNSCESVQVASPATGQEYVHVDWFLSRQMNLGTSCGIVLVGAWRLSVKLWLPSATCHCWTG